MSNENRSSKVSFIEGFAPMARLSRTDVEPHLRRRSSAFFDWTSTAVEKVYQNHIYEVTLWLLVATVGVVLLLAFPLSPYVPHLKEDMSVKVASRAALVFSFVTLLSLRSYFSYSVDLVALGAVVLVTSFEVSDVVAWGANPYPLLAATLTVLVLLVGTSQLASSSARPNGALLAVLLLLSLLLVTNLNFIAAILHRRPTVLVEAVIYGSAVAFATFAIATFSLIISDDSDCPLQVSDRISSGAILYLLLTYHFVNMVHLINVLITIQF